MYSTLFVTLYAVLSVVTAKDNTYKWTVDTIDVLSTTSLEADTLGLVATVTYLGGAEIARKSVYLGDARQQTHFTVDQLGFDLEFSASSTSNISIIWSLVNSANANHTFTQDLQTMSNDTIAYLGTASALQDTLSNFTDTLLETVSPEFIGAAIGASFGPLGALIGAAIGEAVDHVLGDIIDDVFGCDCSVATDTITFLPGDQALFPIQHTALYSGGGSGLFCGASSYIVTSTLSLTNGKLDNVATSLHSSSNWTISLLDNNTQVALESWNLYNFGDTVYSDRGGYTMQAWSPSGGTIELYDAVDDVLLDTPFLITDGQALAFGMDMRMAGKYLPAIISRAFNANLTDWNCQYGRCSAITKLLMSASALPANLEFGGYIALSINTSNVFLTGLYDKDLQRTHEAYIIDYIEETMTRIADAPFALDAHEDNIFYMSSWKEPKIFAVQSGQMAYYDLTTEKWSKTVVIEKLISRGNHCYDGLSTILFTRASIIYANGDLEQYSSLEPESSLTTPAILAMVFNETDPSKIVFTPHDISPLSDSIRYQPYVDAPIAYDSLRNRIYVAGGYNPAGGAPPYLYAINLNPAAAASQVARPFAGTCQAVNGTCIVSPSFTNPASPSPPAATSSTGSLPRTTSKVSTRSSTVSRKTSPSTKSSSIRLSSAETLSSSTTIPSTSKRTSATSARKSTSSSRVTNPVSLSPWSVKRTKTSRKKAVSTSGASTSSSITTKTT